MAEEDHDADATVGQQYTTREDETLHGTDAGYGSREGLSLSGTGSSEKSEEDHSELQNLSYKGQRAYALSHGEGREDNSKIPVRKDKILIDTCISLACMHPDIFVKDKNCYIDNDLKTCKKAISVHVLILGSDESDYG